MNIGVDPAIQVAPLIEQADLTALRLLKNKIDASLPRTLAILEANHLGWRINPAHFLADADLYIPTLRNSYNMLRKSSMMRHNSLSDSFHSVNLQLTLEAITRRQNLKVHSISEDEWRRYLSADFHMSSLDEIADVITNIKCQLKPADALMKLLRGSSGMLAVIAPVLRDSEWVLNLLPLIIANPYSFELILKDRTWTWLSPEALAGSMKYEPMCKAVLHHLRSSPGFLSPKSLWKNDELIFATPDGQCFTHLYKLLLVAGGSIPIEIFNGAQVIVQRLNENGQKTFHTASEAGIDQNIVMAIEIGVDQWFRFMHADNHCVSRLETRFQKLVSSSVYLQNVEHLKLQLLVILINAMPPYDLHIDYDPNIARTLTPLLLQLVTGTSIPQRIADCVLEALLTAIYCTSSPATRNLILTRLSEIINKDSAKHFQIAVGAEISTDERLRGELSSSTATIHQLCDPSCYATDKVKCLSKHLEKPPDGSTWQIRISLLLLYCSYVENMLFMRRYDIVQRSFDLWQSTLDMQTTSVFTLTRCKILRVRGEFAMIRSSLTGILCLSQRQGITWIKILCTMSEALSDLIETVHGQHDQVALYTEDLTWVRKAMVEQLGATKHGTKALNHLLVCLLETAQPRMSADLRSIINHLNTAFKSHPDLEEQELHVRFLIARAQHEEGTCRNLEAKRSWQEVQSYLATYTAFAEESFARNIAQLSIWWLQIRTSYAIPNIGQLECVEQTADYRLPKLWALGRRIKTRYSLFIENDAGS